MVFPSSRRSLFFVECAVCVCVDGTPVAHSKLSGSVWISMKRVCRDVRTAKKQPIVRMALLRPGSGGSRAAASNERGCRERRGGRCR